jgi:hypothetical protein
VTKNPHVSFLAQKTGRISMQCFKIIITLELSMQGSNVICQFICCVVIDLHNWFLLIQEVIQSTQTRQRCISLSRNLNIHAEDYFKLNVFSFFTRIVRYLSIVHSYTNKKKQGIFKTMINCTFQVLKLFRKIA